VEILNCLELCNIHSDQFKVGVIQISAYEYCEYISKIRIEFHQVQQCSLTIPLKCWPPPEDGHHWSKRVNTVFYY
jgi:hypothetical protein